MILLTQLWGNVVVHSIWIIGEKVDKIELVNQEEKESEQKQDKEEKEKEDKIEHVYKLNNFTTTSSDSQTFYFLLLATLHIGEINSPPPKSLS